jgi:S-layer protein
MIGAVAADTAAGSATDASGVYVYGGTNVTITGTKDTTAVKVGTAAFAIDSVNTTGGLPKVNGSAALDPTGDVSITRVSTSTSTTTGLVSATFSTNSAKVYMNGGSTATVRGAGTTDIVDVNTTALLNASGVSTIGTSKLATVNLSGLSNTANITSDAISTVSVTNSRAAVTVNVLNSGEINANAGPINYVLSNVGTEGASPTRVILANNTTGAVNISSGAASTYTGSSNTGSESFVTISSTKATAINLTNSLAVNLGDVQANAAKVATVNGGSATGAVSLTIGTNGSTPEQGLSVTTGSGNDVVTVKASSNLGVNTTTAAVTTVNLGAGNDTLLNLNGSPVTVTGAAFNGGEGVDTVVASLLNSGNAAQFNSFEVLGLDLTSSGASFDASLLAGAAGLALLATSAAGNTVTYTGVKTSQSLTIAAAAASATSVTALTFGSAVTTGTSDSYAVSFGVSSPTSTVVNRSTVEAGVLSINGIENVTLASGGTGFLNNNIDLASNSVRTITLTGAQNLDLAFGADFGGASNTVTSTNGVGVSAIDGSALTGGLTINTTGVTSAFAGLTVKSGSGNDAITLAQVATVEAGAGDDTITAANGAGSVFTGGAGKNTYDVSAAVGTSAEVRITDIKSADKIDLAGTIAAAGTLGAKVDVSAATSLAAALDIANGATGANGSAAAGSAQLLWFQYGGNTYVYSDVADSNGALGSVDANDNIVALTGLVDLIGSTFTTGAVLTIA